MYESRDKRFIIIDIPRSIEESQVHVGFDEPRPRRRRLLSAQPATKPFDTPEPRDGGGGAAIARSSAVQIADLMTAATVEGALEHIDASIYNGPWLLPRVVSGDEARGEGEPDTFIPAEARYLAGSIQDLRKKFEDEAPTFRLMVLDPPWPNRSVRRKKGSYSTVSNLTDMRHLLSQIPVSHHLDDAGLVAVWVTNKPAVLDLMTSPGGQFTSWGLELVAEWTWVKVTTLGEPIYPVDSTWRKPWETLLIAKKAGATTPPGLAPKVIFSVPDLHSRKPNLRGLFSDILGLDCVGLEVFARHLTAGWWSWGDEVLRFQDSRHWCDDTVA